MMQIQYGMKQSMKYGIDDFRNTIKDVQMTNEYETKYLIPFAIRKNAI